MPRRLKKKSNTSLQEQGHDRMNRYGELTPEHMRQMDWFCHWLVRVRFTTWCKRNPTEVFVSSDWRANQTFKVMLYLSVTRRLRS
jgi:hypothetical protein